MSTLNFGEGLFGSASLVMLKVTIPGYWEGIQGEPPQRHPGVALGSIGQIVDIDFEMPSSHTPMQMANTVYKVVWENGEHHWIPAEDLRDLSPLEMLAYQAAKE